MSAFKNYILAMVFSSTLLSLPAHAELTYSFEDLPQARSLIKVEPIGVGFAGCVAFAAFSVGSIAYAVFTGAPFTRKAATLFVGNIPFGLLCLTTKAEAKQIVAQAKAGQVDDPEFQELVSTIGRLNALSVMEMVASGIPTDEIYQALRGFEKGNRSL